MIFLIIIIIIIIIVIIIRIIVISVIVIIIMIIMIIMIIIINIIIITDRSKVHSRGVDQQWKRTTILTVKESFPGIFSRQPVLSFKYIELSPIEVRRFQFLYYYFNPHIFYTCPTFLFYLFFSFYAYLSTHVWVLWFPRRYSCNLVPFLLLPLHYLLLFFSPLSLFFPCFLPSSYFFLPLLPPFLLFLPFSYIPLLLSFPSFLFFLFHPCSCSLGFT